MNKMLIILAMMVAFSSYSVSAAEKTQERSEAGVTVKVSLEGKGDTITVKVAMNTHTVALGQYKFDKIVVLRAAGKEYRPRIISEAGSGHHRSAVAEFDKPKTKEITIVIKDVAGVKEREFAFKDI